MMPQAIIAHKPDAQRRLLAQYEATRALDAADTLERALADVLRAICQSTGWVLGALWEVPTVGDRLRCAGIWREPELQAVEFEAATRTTVFSRGVGLPGRVWASGISCWVPDVTQDDNFPRAPAADKAGLHAAFCFPIHRRGEMGGHVIAVMEFFSREVLPPDDELVRMLDAIGVQIGQFIERKTAERTIRDNEARHHAMLHTALDCIVMMDESGRIVEFNPAAEKTFGFPRDRIIGRELAETIIPPSLRAQHRRGLAAYLAGGEGPVMNKRIEITGLRGDGSEFPVELTITRATINGKALFTAYLRDLSERNASRAVIAAAGQRQRLLLEAIPQIVWTARPDGYLDYFNQRWVDYTGLSVEQSQGSGWQAVTHLDDLQRCIVGWEQAVKAGAAFEIECRFRRARDGAYRWHLCRAVPIRDDLGGVALWIGTSTDIDDRKRAEETLRIHTVELAAMTEQLQRKNQELDQFAYVASHDLKAPLRGIANLSQWIEEDMGRSFPPEARQQMDLLRGRVQRMEAMIDGILQISRIGRGRANLERVEVAQLLREIIDLIHPPEGFSVEIGPDMPVLTTERLRLEQVFMNLIGNAIKHHGPPPGRIRITAEECGRMYEFAVADDGPGIAPEYHNRIFMIFQTLSSRDKLEGTGLGLSLVKKIVEAQGGAVRVESREGAGATFRFTWLRESRADRPRGAA